MSSCSRAKQYSDFPAPFESGWCMLTCLSCFGSRLFVHLCRERVYLQSNRFIMRVSCHTLTKPKLEVRAVAVPNQCRRTAIFKRQHSIWRASWRRAWQMFKLLFHLWPSTSAQTISSSWELMTSELRWDKVAVVYRNGRLREALWTIFKCSSSAVEVCLLTAKPCTMETHVCMTLKWQRLSVASSRLHHLFSNHFASPSFGLSLLAFAIIRQQYSTQHCPQLSRIS